MTCLSSPLALVLVLTLMLALMLALMLMPMLVLVLVLVLVVWLLQERLVVDSRIFVLRQWEAVLSAFWLLQAVK